MFLYVFIYFIYDYGNNILFQLKIKNNMLINTILKLSPNWHFFATFCQF